MTRRPLRVASPSVRDSFIRYTSPVYPGASSILVPRSAKLAETSSNHLKTREPFVSGAEGCRFEPYRAYQLTGRPTSYSAPTARATLESLTRPSARSWRTGRPREWHSRGHGFDPLLAGPVGGADAVGHVAKEFSRSFLAPLEARRLDVPRARAQAWYFCVPPIRPTLLA
jgi:hypothetical protein